MFADSMIRRDQLAQVGEPPADGPVCQRLHGGGRKLSMRVRVSTGPPAGTIRVIGRFAWGRAIAPPPHARVALTKSKARFTLGSVLCLLRRACAPDDRRVSGFSILLWGRWQVPHGFCFCDHCKNS